MRSALLRRPPSIIPPLSATLIGQSYDVDGRSAMGEIRGGADKRRSVRQGSALLGFVVPLFKVKVEFPPLPSRLVRMQVYCALCMYVCTVCVCACVHVEHCGLQYAIDVTVCCMLYASIMLGMYRM
jgi:hypothetical protein